LSQREEAVLENEPGATAKEASVKAYFQSGAMYWDDVYRHDDVRGLRYRERLKSVLKLVDRCSLPAGSHVLDLGSGAGVYSVSLAKRGYSVDAVDAAPAMIERTRRHAVEARVDERVKTSVGSVYHLPFHDEAFSMVLAIGVIPWLDSPERAVAELARVIKPGGYLVMTADNRRRLDVLLDPLKSPAFSPARKLFKSVFRVSYWGWHPAPAGTVYASDHTIDEVDELLATAQLRRVHAETLGFGPFTFFDHEFLPHWLSVKAHRVLQYLGKLGCPGLRSAGWQIVIAARKGAVHESALENKS
jgi:ubiquinone/menaquinone biosynthesis C-methylase UbiE